MASCWRDRVFVLSLQIPNPTEIERKKTTAEPAPGVTTRAQSHRLAAATAAIAEEILVWEIFVRLPAKDVLSCRAVCRRWRGLTSAHDFLLAHHRRQPPCLLLMQRGVESPDSIIKGSHVVPGFSDDDGFKFHASCDGLILLSLSDGTFSVCNPATHQCAPVPGITAAAGCMNTAALYLHSPSGEYRVLYWKWRYQKDHLEDAAYYILKVRQGHSPRFIGSVPPRIENAMMACYRTAPPVVFRNCLHWEPACTDTGILVFDTVVESFRFMSRPADAAGSCTRLCDMQGSIGFSCFGDWTTTNVKIWVLEDYEREVWSLKYHVKFPVERCIREDTQHLVLSHEGDVLVYRRSSGYMHHYDNTGKSLQSWSGNMRLVGLSFKESLVKHDFLPMQGCAWVGQPRFLQTL